MLLPQIRKTDLIEQNADNELMIYDLQINKAYSLNETSSVVFKACNGTSSFDDLKRKYKYTDDLIFLTLDELKKNNLIEGDYTSPFDGMNRREVIKKVGFASIIALPVISALLAPSAANAASNGTCVANAACYAPGQDICAGCTGRTISFKAYTGGVGCAGGGFDDSRTCTGVFPNTTGFPVGITSVT